MNSGLQFYDGIQTSEIQEILIRSANDLIDWTTLTISTLLQDCYYFLFVSCCMDADMIYLTNIKGSCLRIVLIKGVYDPAMVR